MYSFELKKADSVASAAALLQGFPASPERLMTHLGLTPGSVSPFGLINDRHHEVRVVLDRDFQTAARLAFHPNINTRTFTVAAADFNKDGKMDLAFGVHLNGVTVFLGDGNGKFTESRTGVEIRIALPQTGRFADLAVDETVAFAFDARRAVCFRSSATHG